MGDGDGDLAVVEPPSALADGTGDGLDEGTALGLAAGLAEALATGLLDGLAAGDEEASAVAACDGRGSPGVADATCMGVGDFAATPALEGLGLVVVCLDVGATGVLAAQAATTSTPIKHARRRITRARLPPCSTRGWARTNGLPRSTCGLVP